MRSDIKPLPSQERLRELFIYVESTGELVWKLKPASSRANVCFNNRCGGKTAGTITQGRQDGDNRYLVVNFRLTDHGPQTAFQASRVIWKIMTGDDPPKFVDHKDGNTLNNRWANLRSASNGENRWNSKLAKNNKSGVKGVCPDHGTAWKAYISTGNGQVVLGRFKNKQDAINARLNAASLLHGEFFKQA